MLPEYVLEEVTIRESGESAVLDLEQETNQSLLLTLGITHAVEQESVDVKILGSHDGVVWQEEVNFPQKFYCGTYQQLLPKNVYRFLKAAWRVNRWGRGDIRPFFRMYIFAQGARMRSFSGAA